MKKSEWAEGVYENFMESYLDYVTCVRQDGTYYGNGGAKCRKGSPATKKDLAAEKKKAKAGDKQAAKNVAKMEKSGVAAPAPKAKAPAPKAKASESAPKSKEGYSPRESKGATGVRASVKKDAFGNKSSSFDQKTMDERIARAKASKKPAADKKKLVERLEKEKSQIAANNKFVKDVGKNLPKGTKLEVTGTGSVKITTTTKAGDTVSSTYSPSKGYEFRVNSKLDAGGAKSGIQAAQATRRQFEALTKALPNGHIMRTSAYTEDGKGPARQKAYERMGFSKGKPGSQLYAVKQSNGSLSPGKTGKRGKTEQEAQDRAGEMWFKESEDMDKLWLTILTGEEHAENFMESYDFARCQRSDGSIYGTGGTCRKGTPVGDDVTSTKQEKKTKGPHDYPKGGTGGGDVPGSQNIKTYEAQIAKANEALKKDPTDEFAQFVKDDATRRLKPIQDSQKMVDGVVRDVPKGTEVKMNPFGGLETKFTTPGGNTVETFLMKRDFAFTVNGKYDAGVADGNRAEQMAISRQVQRVFNAQVKNAPNRLVLETSAWDQDGRKESRQRAYERVGFAKPTAGGGMYGQIINGKLVPVDPSQVEDTSLLITFAENEYCFAEEVKKEEDAWFEIVFGVKP